MSQKRLIIKDHNKEAYECVKKRLELTNRTCVIHATGTGKAYIALQCIRDSSGHVIYITSMKANLLRFHDLVDMYFAEKSVDYYIYANLNSYNKTQAPSLIILDEFHRAGASEWGNFVLKMLSDNPDAKVLGLTATEIRYLDGERNMAEELFNGDIASSLPLDDALERGILPLPDYSVCVYSYMEEISRMEEDIKEKRAMNGSGEADRILKRIKKKLKNSRGLREYFEDHIKKKNGKYIVFCSNYEHLQEMKSESKKWFGSFKLKCYEMYSANEDAFEQLSRFEKDHSDCLKLLFVISMLNEGVHVNDVDGCILFRETASLNVYFQQIGRVLSTNRTETPVIMDVANNIQNLQKVRDFWEQVERKVKKNGRRKANESDRLFCVVGRDIDILTEIASFDALCSRKKWWDVEYEELKKWYEKNQTAGEELCVPSNVVARYGERSWSLSGWVNTQRARFKQHKLSKEQIDKLNSVGMRWEAPKPIKYTWTQKEEELLKKYYKEDGALVCLLFPNKPKATVMERAKRLGLWMKIDQSEKEYVEKQHSQFEPAWVLDDTKYCAIRKDYPKRNPNYMMYKIAERAYRGRNQTSDYNFAKKVILMKYKMERMEEIIFSDTISGTDVQNV